MTTPPPPTPDQLAEGIGAAIAVGDGHKAGSLLRSLLDVDPLRAYQIFFAMRSTLAHAQHF